MNKIRGSILLGVVFFLFLVPTTGLTAETHGPAGKTVRIGIVLDGPQVYFTKRIDVFKAEIHRAMDAEYRIVFQDGDIRSADWSVATVNREIDNLLNKPDVDMVLALGAVASNEICMRKNLKKPVVAALVVDFNVQKLPHKDGASGVKNLFYVNAYQSVERSIRTFSEITPFHHMAILVDRFAMEGIPALSALARKKAAKYGLKATIVTVGTSIKEALASIPQDVDAVMVTSLEETLPDDYQLLTDELIRRRLPSYSYSRPGAVERGILASMTPQTALQSLARHVAINMQEILEGEDAGRMPVGFNLGEKLTINMKTARAIGVEPGWRIRTEAELLNEYAEGSAQVLTIQDAVRIAVDSNLDLAAAQKNVAAGEQKIYESRSSLLPQIGIGAGGRVIDQDRAETSQNTAPERLISGTVSATQLIYSDKAWSNYSVQKHLQTSLMEERDSLRLDIMRAAATAYLNVLRAKAIERIQKDNLKLTRKNLDRARIRQNIGAAGLDEVYRWESQIANSRQDVLTAESIRLDAMTALNRILNRPLREMFDTAEDELGDPMDIMKKKRLTRIMSDPGKLLLFRDFIVQEGLDASPELRSIKAGISARERLATSSKRAFWLPTLSLQGNVRDAFSREGEGSDDIPGRDDTDWDVGVYATFELFAGGRDMATYRRTREELDQYQIQFNAIHQQIEQRILNSVHLIRVSYPGIELSQDALNAAKKNLELVTDAYSRGIKSIIELLDAQNQALVASQTAANAVYDFMIDLMTMQRSIGQFVLFADEDTKNLFFQRLDAYIDASNQ